MSIPDKKSAAIEWSNKHGLGLVPTDALAVFDDARTWPLSTTGRTCLDLGKECPHPGACEIAGKCSASSAIEALNGARLVSVRRQGSTEGPIIACTLKTDSGESVVMGLPTSPARKLTVMEISQAVARGWCSPLNENKVMDPELCFAISVQVAALLGVVSDGKAQP